jgi:diguanylate cyclase (GGDEF)-like protein
MGSEIVIAPALDEGRLARTRISAWTFPFCFLLLHLIIATCLPQRLDPLSTIFIVAGEIAAMAATIVAARTESTARGFWLLLTGAILFHSSAMSVDAVSEIRQAPMLNHVPALSVLLSLLYDVPLLFAVSLQNDTRVRRPARMIHTLLSIAVGALIYLQIFSFLSLSGSPHPEDAVRITRLFDVMDVFLGVAATLRWLGSTESHERRFFGILTVFLWADAVCCAVHNRALMRHDWISLDLLIVAPYVFLVPMVLTRPARAVTPPSGTLVRAVRSGSPMWLAAALMGAGLIESRSHFYIGLAAAVFAIVAYGILNILIQSRGLEAEESLLASKRALEELVDLDALTGIANRRAFDEALQREFVATMRNRQPVSLLMLDVDLFKDLNDAEGHLKGDEYLVRIAQALRLALPRSGDFVARYGGEEFSAILPATGAAGAMVAAEKVRTAVAELKLHHPTAGIITISIGVSTFDGSLALSPGDLMEAADRGLYKAKRGGRNASVFQRLDSRHAAPSSDLAHRQTHVSRAEKNTGAP